MHTRLFVTLSVAAILAAATLPYISTWSDPFIADDWGHLVYSAGMTTESFIHNVSFHPDDIYYRPVALVWFYLNYLVFGLDATGHHIAKGLLFACCGVLLFLLVFRAAGLRAASVVAGLTFALHPVNTSCAVWLATHGNVLCIFFYLLSLWLFVEARRSRRARVPLYAGFLASMLLCFGSYELGYTLPVVVLLADFLLVSGVTGTRLKEVLRKGWRWHLPHIMLAGAFFLARFLLMERGYSPEKSLGEALGMGVLQVAEMLFLPISRIELRAPDWVRLFPAIIGLSLLVWLLIARRDLRRPAFFALAWSVVGIIPAKNIISPATGFHNTRFMIITSAGFAVLLGTLVSIYWRGRVGKALVGLCVSVVLVVYVWLDVAYAARWSEAAHQSQEVVDATTITCRGASMPFRLVYITYPSVRGVPANTDPAFVISALWAQRTVEPAPGWGTATPYSRGGYDSSLLEPHRRKELIRWFPVQLDSDVLYERGTFGREDDVYSIARGDLERTFFFYWSAQDGTLADCTEPMRARLAQERRAELFHWTAREKFPYARVTLTNCLSSPQHEKGILYISPTPGSLSFPMLQIDLEETDCMDFDQVEIEMSAASKSSWEGFFTAFVTWQWEGEEASPDALHEHAVAFSGRYHPYHKFRHYRVPVAHHFLKSGSRRIASLYIAFPPDVSEIAIRSVRLSRFTE